MCFSKVARLKGEAGLNCNSQFIINSVPVIINYWHGQHVCCCQRWQLLWPFLTLFSSPLLLLSAVPLLFFFTFLSPLVATFQRFGLAVSMETLETASAAKSGLTALSALNPWNRGEPPPPPPPPASALPNCTWAGLLTEPNCSFPQVVGTWLMVLLQH